MNTSCISDLPDDIQDYDPNDIDMNKPDKVFFNPELPVEIRLSAIDHVKSGELLDEIIYRALEEVQLTKSCWLVENLLGLMSNTSLGLSYIFNIMDYMIVYQTDLNIKTNDILDKLFVYLRSYSDGIKTVPMYPVYYRLITMFLEMEYSENTKESNEQIINLYKQFLLDTRVSSEFRYKSMNAWKKKIIHHELLYPTLLEFFQSVVKTNLKTGILIAQYYMFNSKQHTSDTFEFIRILRTFAQDESTEYNTRADIYDLIMQKGSEEDVKDAKAQINKLGGGDKNNNVYENKQNVHSVNIDEALQKLLQDTSDIQESKYMPFTQIEQKILGDEKEHKDIERIKDSLKRIANDNALYSNITIEHILERIWYYLSKLNESDRQPLYIRLIEELTEMDDTCSSGHMYRLINILSGFNGYEIKISFNDQIIANMNGRLLAKLNKVEPPELRQKLILDLAERDFNKPEFNKFIRNTVPSIIQELHSEFVPKYTSEDDFNLAIRDGMLKFEGFTGDMKV